MAPVTIVDEEWFLYCYIVAEQARESLKVCLNIFYTCFDNRQPATGNRHRRRQRQKQYILCLNAERLEHDNEETKHDKIKR